LTHCLLFLFLSPITTHGMGVFVKGRSAASALSLVNPATPRRPGLPHATPFYRAPLPRLLQRRRYLLCRCHLGFTQLVTWPTLIHCILTFVPLRSTGIVLVVVGCIHYYTLTTTNYSSPIVEYSCRIYQAYIVNCLFHQVCNLYYAYNHSIACFLCFIWATPWLKHCNSCLFVLSILW
jgi:hypothetical protein